MVVSPLTDQVGRVLGGRYRLIAPTGTGSSAQVYQADDVRLKRRVAVKLLHAELAQDAAFLRRFEAEAKAVASLNHPNILTVFDWGYDDGVPYLVTEYLAGGSMRAMLDKHPRLSVSQALLIGIDTAKALAVAHRRGFVHRDIKPANLLFGDDRRLRVADFGLARALAEAGVTEPQGAMVGTARYTSPEQAKGDPSEGRSDVYSLGLVLIEAVTGEVPFAADTREATLAARTSSSVDVPEALGELRPALERAGQLDPADRPEAAELARLFDATAKRLPRPKPLPLAMVTPVVDLTAAGVDRDATLHAPLGGNGGADAVTVVDVDAPAAPPRAPAYLDDALAADADLPRRRRWPWLVLAGLLAALLGGGAAWAYVQSQLPTYEVPRVVGLQEEDAMEQLEGYGWDIEREETRIDGTTPGEVVEVDPEPGSLLREGESLRLVVSLGNTEAAVPTDLPGKTLDEARAALAEAGRFVVAEPVEEVYDEEVDAGRVISLGADVPARLPKESGVPLVVSRGPRPREVPSGLEGGSFEAAEAALAGVQLRAARIEEFSDDVEAGLVITLRPGPGEPAARDSTVEVVVSKGPDLVAVPEVQGRTLAEAVAAIEAAGLTAGDAYGPANGQPFETDPPSGTKIKRGSPVDIYLRR